MNKRILLNWVYIVVGLGLLFSCSGDEESLSVGNATSQGDKGPQLLSFTFDYAINPYQLSESVKCEIEADSLLVCRIRNIMPDKVLKATFDYQGDSLTINGKKAISGITAFDFKTPAKVAVFYGGNKKEYTAFVHSFTGLPVIWIETKGRKEITSRDVYINAYFKLQENVLTRGPGDVVEDSVQIKGRGNSTWSAPKKPYRLKFGKEYSLLGEKKDKAWVLLANYYDMTMLRNQLAFNMSRISDLDYTPRAHFVEVMLNGKYHGTYQLCEKLKIAKHRVNVGNNGFLMEIDSRAIQEEAPFFKVEHIPQVVNIKDPDTEIGDVNFNYIKDYLAKADRVLFSDYFKDPQIGWQKYMDISSFVDYYIINEIAKNGDVCCFYTSCYMNLKRGGKLKMGPIWDNDNSFGKHDNPDLCTVDGWCLRNVAWYTRLFQDKAFVNALKERYDYFYSKKDELIMDINNNAEYLRYAVDENNARWGTLYGTTINFNYNVWGSYQNEVQYLKDWLNLRMDWLYMEIKKL